MEFIGEGEGETDLGKKSWYQAREARTNKKGREERRRGDRREDGGRGRAQAGRNHFGREKFGKAEQNRKTEGGMKGGVQNEKLRERSVRK